MFALGAILYFVMIPLPFLFSPVKADGGVTPGHWRRVRGVSPSPCPTEERQMSDLEQAIRERHSIRMFVPRPVPRGMVDEALALAQHAPSNSNIQPWRLVFVSGPARHRLKDAL